MSNISSDKRLAAGLRILDRGLDRAVEIFAVAEAGERIGQALGPDRLQALLQVADLVFRQRQPVLQRLVGVAHLAGGFHQRFDDRFDLVGLLGEREFLGRAGQAGAVARRHSERLGDQRHHVVDFADHARADLVDAVAGLDLRKIGLVDLLEIGLGQLAVARQRLVDDLVEGRIVPGGVDVPDFIIARHGGLPQRLDLPQGDFGEGHCAFVFVEHLDHGHVPKITDSTARTCSNN